MYKDMDPYELEMGLNRMRHYYPELELTDEQAMKMLEVKSSTEVSSDVSGRRVDRRLAYDDRPPKRFDPGSTRFDVDDVDLIICQCLMSNKISLWTVQRALIVR